MALSPSTGMLSGTPTQSGTVTFTVMVTGSTTTGARTATGRFRPDCRIAGANERSVYGHGLVKRVCKRNCKRTTRHSMAPTITRRDHGTEIGELDHTLSHWTAQASMRILELENRCAGNRTVGSNPTLSANNLRWS